HCGLAALAHLCTSERLSLSAQNAAEPHRPKKSAKSAKLESRFAELLAELEHVFFPFALEGIHVCFAEGLLQGVVAGRVFFLMIVKVAIELDEQVVLLQVITKIAHLAVVCALISIVETAFIKGGQRLERRHAVSANGRLQPRQPPVGEAAN